MAGSGAYFLYFGLAGIAANLGAGFLSDRFGRPFTAWPALILLGLGSIALAFIDTVPAAAIFSSVLAGIGVNGSMVVLLAWLVDVSGERLRATALSLEENTIDLSFAAGTFLFGLAGSYIGFKASFAAAGILILSPAVALLQLFRSQQRKRLPGARNDAI